MLARLTALLVSYGPMGILVLSFIDSAGIPMASGMDALVILVAIKAPSRAYFAASMGVVGSLIGNLVLFMAARTGVRWFVRDVPHPGPRRFHEWFERYGLLTVFVPAAMPIPLPLKIFVISAAIARTPLSPRPAQPSGTSPTAVRHGRILRCVSVLRRSSTGCRKTISFSITPTRCWIFRALRSAVLRPC